MAAVRKQLCVSGLYAVVVYALCGICCKLIRMITSAAIVITAVYSRFCDLFIVSLCACWITGSACDVCSMRITAWHLTELSRAIARYEYALLRSPWVYSCCPRSCRETISSVADFMSAMADFAR